MKNFFVITEERKQKRKQVNNEVNANLELSDQCSAFTEDMEKDLYGTKKKIRLMLGKMSK